MEEKNNSIPEIKFDNSEFEEKIKKYIDSDNIEDILEESDTDTDNTDANDTYADKEKKSTSNNKGGKKISGKKISKRNKKLRKSAYLMTMIIR